MSDRSGQSDTDNSFAGISFEGVNAVPPQSGENGDTINLADVADVSEQDDVSNAATETMPPLNFASDQTQPFQSFPTAGAAETTPAGSFAINFLAHSRERFLLLFGKNSTKPA